MTAPTQVLVAQSAESYGTASYATGSGSCTAGRVLVCLVTGLTNSVGAMSGLTLVKSAGTATITSSAGSGNFALWTPGLIQGPTGNFRPFAAYYWAEVTGSGTITVTVDGTPSIFQWHVQLHEGSYLTSGPLGFTASNTNVTDTSALTLTLSGSPASDSVTIGGLVESTNAACTVSEGSGFTVLYEYDGSGGNASASEYDDTSPGNTVTWTDLCVGSTIDSNGWVAVAVELKAAAAAAATATPGQFVVPMQAAQRASRW